MCNCLDLPSGICNQVFGKIELQVYRCSIARVADLQVPRLYGELFAALNSFKNGEVISAIVCGAKLNLKIVRHGNNDARRLALNIQPAVPASNRVSFFGHFLSYGDAVANEQEA
jgi:hypothetical protein